MGSQFSQQCKHKGGTEKYVEAAFGIRDYYCEWYRRCGNIEYTCRATPSELDKEEIGVNCWWRGMIRNDGDPKTPQQYDYSDLRVSGKAINTCMKKPNPGCPRRSGLPTCYTKQFELPKVQYKKEFEKDEKYCKSYKTYSLSDQKNAEDCMNECVDNKKFTCNAFAYSKSNNRCVLYEGCAWSKENLPASTRKRWDNIDYYKRKPKDFFCFDHGTDTCFDSTTSHLPHEFKSIKSGENSATTIAGTGSVRGRHRITLNAPIEFSQVINCCPTTTMDTARVITITQKTKNIVRNMNRSIRKR